MFRSWRKQLGFLIVAAMTFVSLVPAVHAASAPNIITYQGRVLNANGVPVSDSSLNMSFALYTALTGGTCVWSNSSASCASTTARSVTLTTGLFTENLGDTGNTYAAIADSIFGDNATVYLEVVIAGETLSPRRQITAAPYALNADTLDGIDSATLQLFETGSSRTFEDDAPVIIGSNAVFSYGSGGVGDTRVEDELEVMGDGYIDNDLVVGASTSSIETITNGVFSLSGDDLFVAGMLGVEGTIYTDGGLNVVGTISAGDVDCADCFDFTEFSDTLALDASTSIALDGSESFTITNGGTGDTNINLSSTGDFVVQDTGSQFFIFGDDRSLDYTTNQTTTDAFDFFADGLTSAVAIDLSVDALTTGKAINVSSTSNALTSGRLVDVEHTATYSATTELTGHNLRLGRSLTMSDGGAGNTLTVSGDILNITNSLAATAGTIVDSSDLLSVNQLFSSATGDVIEASNSGTGRGVFIDQNGNGGSLVVDAESTSASVVDIDGSLTLSGQLIQVIGGDFTDDTGRALFIDVTESTNTADLVLIQSNVGSSNNNVFRIEADGEVFSDVGFTAGAFSTNYMDSEIQTTGDMLLDIDGGDLTFEQATIIGGGSYALTINSSGTLTVDDTTIAGSGALTLQSAGSGALQLDAASGLVSTTTGDDFSVGANSLTSAFSVDESANLVRVGDGAGTNGQINLYASNGSTGSLSWTTGDYLDISGGALNIGDISTTAAAVNLYDDAVNKTIDIAGVTNNATDTVNIATNGTSQDAITIGNTNASTTVAVTGGDDWNITTGGVATFTYSSTGEFALCHATNGVSTGAITDCASGPTADYAEQYPVASGVEYGDIVVPGTSEITTNDGQTMVQLVKSIQAYQGPVVGIVSNNYGDFTSAGYNIAAEDNPMPVALVGRVSVKVTGEGGSISAGDYLTTSSTPGKAMKATKVGRVIGMALEDWDGVSSTLMVQVNNSWSMGDVLGTDGTSTLVTGNVIVSSVGTASAKDPTFDSYGLSLRGSAWNGSEAEAVEMMLQNVVDDEESYRLSVRNTTETEVAYITNEGIMKIAGDMIIGGRLYPSDRGTPQTEKYIYYDGSAGPGGDFMRTNAKGWSTGSYDFAEMFPSGEELVSGDVVVFTGTGETVQRATGAQGEQLAGIVSTRPGFLAGENVAGAYPIALAGRVPTKVSTANGSIAVGDPLTASTTSGVAMKAIDAGQIIGYALESYIGSESDNLILTYVNVGYWSGGPQTITIVQNQASQASSDAQGFSALNMSGNIYMATNQILSIGRLEGISGIWSIESDGTIKTEGSLKIVTESYQGIDVETVAVTSPESVITLTGTSTLVEGRAEVRFELVLPEYNDVISAITPIRVIVTPSGPVSLYVSEKDQNHFVVERFVGSADVEFDWMVTGYRKGYEPEEEEEQVEGVDQVDEVLVPLVPSDLSALLDEEESVSEEELEPVVQKEPASPESPEKPIVDSAIEDDGGGSVEPSDVVIETPSTLEP